MGGDSYAPSLESGGVVLPAQVPPTATDEVISFLDLCHVLLSHVSYKAWEFFLGVDGEGCWLQVRFRAFDEVAGEFNIQHGRKWRLSIAMTRSEIVQTALAAVLAAEEHEAREQFTYKGQPIFGPHFDVDKLHALAAGEAILPGLNLDVRP